MRKLLIIFALLGTFGLFMGCEKKDPEPAQNATDIATESADAPAASDDASAEDAPAAE